MEKSNTPLLEMRNIKKDFFGNQVLTDINLTLNEGESSLAVVYHLNQSMESLNIQESAVMYH